MHPLLIGQLHFFGFDDGTPLVVAAVWADVMRQLGLITLGASRQIHKCCLLMSSALSAPGFGNLALG